MRRYHSTVALLPSSDLKKGVIYSDGDIRRKFAANSSLVNGTLSALPMAGGLAPRITSLNGWVFEQTVRSCLLHELAKLGLVPEVKEQHTLFGKSRVDLLVGQTAVELKLSGIFSGAEPAKYAKYRLHAERRGWRYVYLSCDESYRPYREAARRAFGAEQAFFLDETGAWERFVLLVARGIPAVNSAGITLREEVPVSLDLDEILMLFALRFDGWKYAEVMARESGTPKDGFFPPLTSCAIDDQMFPEDPLACMATYFALQRFLGKWGGDTLPHHSAEHTTYRLLFLHTYRWDVPPEYRQPANHWYDRWERYYAHRREACAAAVRSHIVKNVSRAAEG